MLLTGSILFLQTSNNEAEWLALERFSARKQETYLIAAKLTIDLTAALVTVKKK